MGKQSHARKQHPCSWRGVQDTTLCEKVCQLSVTGRGFSPCTPVSSANKTDRHDITEILLKVALNTLNHKNNITASRTTPLFHSQLQNSSSHSFCLT